MGYLSEFEHDIFVSYAHSDLLNDWSRRLIDELRTLVAGGLKLRGAPQVGVWWDYDLRGNQPLTRQLREKVKGAGVLLVLMSDWYLDSAWCKDERNWFVNAVRQRGADRVFVVRVCATDYGRWPKSFKDERGHPLVGYDFARDADDDLSLPKGHPRPEDSSDSKEYYAALEKLARDIVGQLKALERAKFPVPDKPQPNAGLKEQGESVFLAAVPEELDDLREELAGLLRDSGCVVVPEANPLDFDEVHERAPEWVSNCDKFVQVLGKHIGRWPYDNAGFVMYQHELARKSNKPIYVYRAPAVNASVITHPGYRRFLDGFDQDDTGGLQSFAERVAIRLSGGNGDFNQSVFMMAGPRDKVLEQEIRRLMEDLDISVFPITQSSEAARDVSSIIDEQGFLDVLKRCGAIVLLAGQTKSSPDFWLDRTILYMEQDIKRKLGALPPYAVIDAPPPPPINASRRMSVLLKDSPSFRDELQSWLRDLSARASTAPKEHLSSPAQGGLN
jgi:TIR domain